MVFTALIFLLVCGNLYGHVDWSPFECLENIDGDLSLRLIKDLPIHQYWDVQKGSFRTGIIGELLNKTLPQYVTSLNTKVGKGSTFSSIESLVVDQAAIYMHGISALRSVGNISRAVHDVVNMTATANWTSSLHVDIGPSVDDMKTLQHATLVYLATLSTTVAEVEDDFQLTKQLMSEGNSTAVADLLLVQNRQLNLLDGHFRRVLRTVVEKYDRIGRGHAVSESRLRAVRKHFANEEHSAAYMTSLRQVERTMEALRFRAAEELKMAEQQQAFEDSQLSLTKSEVLQAEVEQVIAAFFQEVLSCMHQLMAEPSATLSAIMYGTAVVAVVLTILELARTVSDAARRLAGASHLPQVRQLTNRPGIRNRTGAPLAWPAAVAEDIHEVYLSMHTAIANGLPLPCVLVAGPTGSGKSAAIQSLLDNLASALHDQPRPPFIVEVCGADLRALGDGEATRFLNDLVCRSRAGPLLLVVDDADCIIRRRHGPTDFDGTLAVRHGRGDMRSSGCLFALLAGLRVNCAGVGLLLTTRLSVNGVDEAILDRCGTSYGSLLRDLAQYLQLLCVGCLLTGWMQLFSCRCRTVCSGCAALWQPCSA